VKGVCLGMVWGKKQGGVQEGCERWRAPSGTEEGWRRLPLVKPGEGLWDMGESGG